MYVLDTNIISELIKPKPDTGVLEWIGSKPISKLYTTAISQAEMYYGIHLLPDGKRKIALFQSVNQVFSAGLLHHILEFNSNSAMIYAEIASKRKNSGLPISHADAQIAAICILHQFTLITRNVTDFSLCGVELINPFDSL